MLIHPLLTCGDRNFIAALGPAINFGISKLQRSCKQVLTRMVFRGIAVFIVLISYPVTAREWSDSSGKYRVAAEYVTSDDKTVQLKKSDGNVITVPLDRLSADDRSFIERLKIELATAVAARAEKANFWSNRNLLDAWNDDIRRLTQHIAATPLPRNEADKVAESLGKTEREMGGIFTSADAAKVVSMLKELDANVQRLKSTSGGCFMHWDGSKWVVVDPLPLLPDASAVAQRKEAEGKGNSTIANKKAQLVISGDLRRKHPELIELIMASPTMNDEERQYWLNILPIMTPEQVAKHRDILENVKRQLDAITKSAVYTNKGSGSNLLDARHDDIRRLTGLIAYTKIPKDRTDFVIAVLQRLESRFDGGLTEAEAAEVRSILKELDAKVQEFKLASGGCTLNWDGSKWKVIDPLPPLPEAPAVAQREEAEGKGNATVANKKAQLSISDDLRRKHPELIELIVASQSMSDEERQYWLNILPIMTPEQVTNYRGILENEKRQLDAIDRKYGLTKEVGDPVTPQTLGRWREQNARFNAFDKRWSRISGAIDVMKKDGSAKQKELANILDTAMAQDWRIPAGVLLRRMGRGVFGFVSVGRNVVQGLVQALGIIKGFNVFEHA